MRHNPSNPDWIDRDRFVLSAGHASMLLYSILYLTGLSDDARGHQALPAGRLADRRAIPSASTRPGIEATTGPLGQGISMSVGLALAERMLAARFNQDGHEIVGHYTFTIASDGDIQEGVCGRGVIAGGPSRAGPPDRLLRRQQDPAGQSGRQGHVRGRRRALRGLRLARPERRARTSRSSARRGDARGDGGRGPAFADHRAIAHRLRRAATSRTHPAAHGSPLGEDEVRAAKEFYGWDPDKHFYVPDAALAHFRSAVSAGASSRPNGRSASAPTARRSRRRPSCSR